MTHISAEDMIKFATLAFGKPDYARTFPTIFSCGTTDHLHPVVHNNELVALAATHPFIWINQGDLVRGFCIGSVCSEPKHRGKGYGLEAIARAEAFATISGADFVFLFSELNDYYAQAGYEQLGTEYFVPFSAPNIHSTATSHNTRMLFDFCSQHLSHEQTRDLELLVVEGHNLANDHRSALAVWQFFSVHASQRESHLPFWEFTSDLTIPNLSFLLLCSPKGIQAAAMLGKGADFENILHGLTFVHPTDALILLQKSLAWRKTLGFTLMVPPGAESLFAEFAVTHAPMLHAKTLPGRETFAPRIFAAVEARKLYPRSLQSV